MLIFNARAKLNGPMLRRIVRAYAVVAGHFCSEGLHMLRPVKIVKTSEDI